MRVLNGKKFFLSHCDNNFTGKGSIYLMVGSVLREFMVMG